MKNVTLNKAQELYCIRNGNGYSSYGYTVVIDHRNALAKELERPDLTKGSKGTLKAYQEYMVLIDIARNKHNSSGYSWKSQTGLTPQLIGLEGKRVEVITSYGETERFWVGRSTGWVPCHLEIKTRRSSGGGCVIGAPFKSVRVVEHCK